MISHFTLYYHFVFFSLFYFYFTISFYFWLYCLLFSPFCLHFWAGKFTGPLILHFYCSIIFFYFSQFSLLTMVYVIVLPYSQLGFQFIFPEQPSDILLIALDLFQSLTRAPDVCLGPQWDQSVRFTPLVSVMQFSSTNFPENVTDHHTGLNRHYIIALSYH